MGSSALILTSWEKHWVLTVGLCELEICEHWVWVVRGRAFLCFHLGYALLVLSLTY